MRELIKTLKLYKADSDVYLSDVVHDDQFQYIWNEMQRASNYTESIKRNNSTLPHTGEMASWQMRGILVRKDEVDEVEEDDGSICEPLYITADYISDNQLIQISIHDQGGGLPTHKNPSNVFEFASSKKLYDRMDDQQTYAMTRSPLRGLGVGLNQSRLMLRHFGGDLKLVERQDGHRLSNGVELKKGVSTILELSQDLSRPEQSITT